MVWHAKNKSSDGFVKHAPNSKAWAHIDASWQNFASEPRNVILGLVPNGVNPYGEKRSSWSTWRILLLNYNLPPWLVTKKFFAMLVLLIHGKEFVNMHNFDVYIPPLIEELQDLWKGVLAYDLGRAIGQRQFTLRAILMWTIHDYLTYGLVSRSVHQGYKACATCGLDINSRHFIELGKVVYEGSCRWLARYHPYRRNQNLAHFNGKEEQRSKPQPIIALETIRFTT
jgi:hypothetical protein